MGECYKQVVIPASIESVWETIKDFHRMEWAPGVITSLEKIGSKSGTEPGAQRVLNGVFRETLTEFEPDDFRFSYSIDDGPGPVASDKVKQYKGTVQLSKHPDGCQVEWSSRFDSADETAVEQFCNPIYQALLRSLKESMS